MRKEIEGSRTVPRLGISYKPVVQGVWGGGREGRW
jgi:hypothetical protein